MDIAFALARPYFESGYRLKGDTLPPSLKSLLPNAVVVRPPAVPAAGPVCTVVAASFHIHAVLAVVQGSGRRTGALASESARDSTYSRALGSFYERWRRRRAGEAVPERERPRDDVSGARRGDESPLDRVLARSLPTAMHTNCTAKATKSRPNQ